MRKQFDWPTIVAAYERGMTPVEIARTLPEAPSRQAIEKRAQREGWQVATLPNAAPGSQLTGTDATKAVVLANIRKGVPIVLAAKAAGITDRTVRNWREDDAEFSEMMAAARAAFVATNISRIHDAGERDWRAAGYLLERIPETRDQFGQKQHEGGLTIVLNVNRTLENEAVPLEHNPGSDT